MPKATKPRKRYKPKPKLLNAVDFVVETHTLMRNHDGKYVDLWLLRNHGAMHAVTRGVATRTDVDTLMAALNITSAFVATLGYPDDLALVPKAEAALAAMCERSSRLGRVVIRAEETQALNELLSLHDEFFNCVTVGQFETAFKHAKRELLAGRATKVKEIA